MKAQELIPVKTLKEFKILHKEVDEIKMDVGRILFILENEGEVKESVLRELKGRGRTPREQYIHHEEVRKALMK